MQRPKYPLFFPILHIFFVMTSVGRPRTDAPRMLLFPLGASNDAEDGWGAAAMHTGRSTRVSGRSVRARISVAKWSSPACRRRCRTELGDDAQRAGWDAATA
jgi:hypothetical protein